MRPLENEIHPDMVKVWKIHALIGAGVLTAIVLAYLFFYD